MTGEQTLWGAISRAVRTPSRIDREISNPGPASLIVLLRGDAAFDSETLIAYELGYRAQLGPAFSAAVSTFYNDYDNLRSTSLSPPDPIFGLPFPLFFENNLEGETHGFELSATFQALERWRVHRGYRLLEEDIRVKPGQFDFNNALNETSDPEQQLSVRSSLDLGSNVELDARATLGRSTHCQRCRRSTPRSGLHGVGCPSRLASDALGGIVSCRAEPTGRSPSGVRHSLACARGD
jgi:iron complex outermembrane recepter protein